MTVLLTIAVTALVVGAVVAAFTARRVRSAMTSALGGRAGEDPTDVHHRLLGDAHLVTEQAVARAELLELSLDALTTAVVVTDQVGHVLVRNKLARDSSVQSHEQTLVDAATTELLAQAVKGQVVEREVSAFGPPQRTLFVQAVPVVVDEQVIGALAIIEDVSQHHRIDKVRRDFIANMSHELRTPVGAASLLAELLVGEDDATTRAQLTDRLLIETDRMIATIDGLLELSRLESGTQSYNDAIVVRELVDEAVSRNKVSAEAAQVQVSVLSPAEPIVAQGNRTQLLSALVNMIENAVKYSSRGDSVNVRVRTDDDLLCFIVQDTGRGIPARDLDRIFERFYRVDRSRDASTGGTGIGLSVVRHVALNHGGQVTVESFEGDGSTFTMSVPLRTGSRTTSTHAPEGEQETPQLAPVSTMNEQN